MKFFLAALFYSGFLFTLGYSQEPESATLTPGGSITLIDGVVIEAPEGALDAPLEIFVERVDPATLTTPLPELYEVIGHLYRISTSTEFYASGSTFLRVAFPILETTPIDKLGFAHLQSSEGITDVPDGPVEYAWFINDARYDPDAKIALASTTYLSEEGNVMGAISGGNLQTHMTKK